MYDDFKSLSLKNFLIVEYFKTLIVHVHWWLVMKIACLTAIALKAARKPRKPPRRRSPVFFTKRCMFLLLRILLGCLVWIFVADTLIRPEISTSLFWFSMKNGNQHIKTNRFNVCETYSFKMYSGTRWSLSGVQYVQLRFPRKPAICTAVRHGGRAFFGDIVKLGIERR